jgi:hypothetical protein
VTPSFGELTIFLWHFGTRLLYLCMFLQGLHCSHVSPQRSSSPRPSDWSDVDPAVGGRRSFDVLKGRWGSEKDESCEKIKDEIFSAPPKKVRLTGTVIVWHIYRKAHQKDDAIKCIWNKTSLTAWPQKRSTETHETKDSWHWATWCVVCVAKFCSNLG